MIILKRKRKIALNEEKRDEHRDKIARIILNLIIQNFDEINTIYFFIFSDINFIFS